MMLHQAMKQQPKKSTASINRIGIMNSVYRGVNNTSNPVRKINATSRIGVKQ